jgi:F-type H+-transporting ATPase subunit delta
MANNRLDNNKVASRYARALFESTVESGDAKAVAQDLETVSAVFSQVPALNRFMENPGIPAAEKLQLVDKEFGQNVNPWVNRLLHLLVENGRMPVLPQLAIWFTEYMNQRDNVARAEVVSAVELEEELRRRIQKTLESSLGFSRVDVQNRVDPGILGGVIIKVQDKVFDGSYVGRLEELRKQLVKTG